MKMLFTSLLLTIMLGFSTVFAAESNDASLAALLNSVQTMQANFTQVVYDNRNKAIQTSYGKMAMQRPGKFRWDVVKPIPQLIIANQTRLWIYDPDLQQVTIRSLSKASSETPALLLSDVDSVLTKDYKVAAPQTKEGMTWYNLTPKSNDNMFQTIQLGFLKNQLNEMRLLDHLGHTTSVQFKQIQINKPLAVSLFTYKPRADVDVVDETRQN